MILNWENLGENWFEGIIERFKREHIYSEKMYEYNDCEKYLDIIANLVKYIEAPFPDKSLIYFRVREMPKQLSILHFLIMATMYPQSIRELRYILEAVIQAYYIDTEHPEANMKCKLEILKEIEMKIGGRLIDATDLNGKNQLKELYKDMSRYTHSSHEKLEPAMERELALNIFFGFNERLFKESTILTKRTVDAILFVILSFEQGLITKVKTDDDLVESLHNLKLVDSLLNNRI